MLYILMGIRWKKPCTPPVLPWPIQVDPGTQVYILIGFRQGIKNVNTAKADLKLPQHEKETRQSCTGSLWVWSEGVHMVTAEITVPTIFSNMSD